MKPSLLNLFDIELIFFEFPGISVNSIASNPAMSFTLAKHSERRRARAVHRIGTAAASKTPIPKVAVASPAGYLPPKRGAISQSKTLVRVLHLFVELLAKFFLQVMVI